MIERKSTLRQEVLAKYPNSIFVETGTYDGSGCLVAVAAGFKRIISIEIAPRLYEFSRDRLKDYPQIELHLGDSVDILPGILATIHEPATFWIDAHNPQDGTPHVGWDASPLMRELNVIGAHHIINHTILIDDCDLMGTEHLDYATEHFVEARLHQINPFYRFGREDGNKPGSIFTALP